MNEITALKRWLKKPGNSLAKLAYALGYRSSTTISQWIVRNRIPKHMCERVLAVLEERP